MKIGNLETKSNYFLPARAGYSDVAMRVLCYRYGAGLCFTEMVSAKGLCYGSENTKALLVTDDREDIKAVQLFGREPEFIARAIKHEALKEFDIIDFNFGCPVPKIVGNGEGSAMMKEPDLVKKVIETAVEASEGRVITAKIRAGFNKDSVNAVEVACAIEEGGASMVTVHGRTRDMFYTGKADLNIIKKVKDSVKIPVVGNGDVVDKESASRMFEVTGCDGIAIARGALGRPYVFAELRDESSAVQVLELLKEQALMLAKVMPERIAVNNMKKHIAFYMKGIRNGKDVKLKAFQAKNLDDILSLSLIE